MNISFGFLDVPYNKQASYKQVGKRPPRRIKRSSTATTRDVANILEDKYGIVDYFLSAHGEEVIHDIIEGQLEQAARPATGRGSRTQYLAKAISKGEDVFRTMLDNRELDGRVEGVPTQAADLGYRYGRSRAPGRPSFIDTGLYRASFHIEVDEEE